MAEEKRSQRLARADWMQAAISALAEEGFTAVRADTLAKKLGVSRGSFYWHFEDVPAFEIALVEYWRDLAIGAINKSIADVGPSEERFREIMRLALFSINKVEIAMRAWSTVNPRIKTALMAIDEGRIDYMVRLVQTVSTLPQEHLRAKACVAYWTYLGHAVLSIREEPDLDAVVDELVEMIRAK